MLGRCGDSCLSFTRAFALYQFYTRFWIDILWSAVSSNFNPPPSHRYVRAYLQNGCIALPEGEEDALIELIKSVSAVSTTLPVLRQCATCLSTLGVYGTRYMYLHILLSKPSLLYSRLCPAAHSAVRVMRTAIFFRFFLPRVRGYHQDVGGSATDHD